MVLETQTASSTVVSLPNGGLPQEKTEADIPGRRWLQPDPLANLPARANRVAQTGTSKLVVCRPTVGSLAFPDTPLTFQSTGRRKLAMNEAKAHSAGLPWWPAVGPMGVTK